MTEQSYNEVPYPSFSHRETHPSHLATLATLLGMKPTPVERCRVLELGCAAGGNLIPMAQGLPNSHFVGVDYAARQIEEGRGVLKMLGIQNVSLQHMSLMDIGPDFGEFDYIIAHGVYSWVPEEVRQKVLDICRQNLAPNGVAFVSYNTYPGWHMLDMVREIILYHTRNIPDSLQRVVAGLDLISFLAESAPATQEGYISFLHTYITMREKRTGEEQDDVYSFLLHDELSEVNTPFYFHEFAAEIEAHGLQYLADGDFPSMIPSKFPPEVVQKLGTMVHSSIEFEQYLDFLTSRFFRKSLLCHQNVTVHRRVQVTPELLSAFHIVSHAKRLSDTPDILGKTPERFQLEMDVMLTSDHPVTKAAMLHLCRVAPQAVPFQRLLAEAMQQVYGENEPDEVTRSRDAQLLANTLVQGFGYHMRLVELRTHNPHFLTEISKRPLASPFARLQAQSKSSVTNVRHERVALEGLARFLLLHLDGTRTRDELLALLRAAVAEGHIALTKEGEVVQDMAEVETRLADEVNSTLLFLAYTALLVG